MHSEYGYYKACEEKWTRVIAYVCFALGALAFASLCSGAQILATQTSPDGQWRVTIEASTHPPKFELWSTPSVGGVRRKIGSTVPHDNDVFEFRISADSKRVVYRQGRTATGESKLYSTRIDAAGGTLISQPLPADGRVSAGIALTSGGMSVRYRWSAVAGAAGDYYAVNVYGGTILRELFADGFESGNAGAWQ